MSKAKAKTWTADRRICLDAKGKVVDADHPDRVSLLVRKGETIPLERAQELGLVEGGEPKPGDAQNTPPTEGGGES